MIDRLIGWLGKLVDRIAASEEKRERAVWLAKATISGIALDIIMWILFSFIGYTPRLTDWIAITSIPILFVLWVFRTHDTRQSINQNTYNQGIELIFREESVAPRSIGLLRLLDLRKQGLFVLDINLIISQELNLEKAFLSKADLAKTELKGVNLKEAKLMEANLTQADMRGAYLTGADLTYANLTKVNLADADLTRATLTGTDLTQADMAKADMAGINLAEANLTGTNLAEASLAQANLTRANLAKADLAHADLKEAELINTDLTGANLTGVSFIGANITGADLTGATWSLETEFNNTIYSDDTKFPKGFIPAAYLGLVKKNP